MITKIGAHKISQYEEILELLQIKCGDNDLILDYESQNDNCALHSLVKSICAILKSERLKIIFENKVLRIENAKYQRALTLILAYFGDYLLLSSFDRLENALEIHLKQIIDKLSQIDVFRSKSVGITLIGYTKENKHIGEIDKILMNDFEIIYCCDSYETFTVSKERICDHITIISHPMYYAYLPNMVSLVSVNTPLPLRCKKLSCKIVHLGHNFNEALQYTLYRTDKKYILESLYRERLSRADYFVAHTAKDCELLELGCKKFGLSKDCIIKGGNPSLDWALRYYRANQVSNNVFNNGVYGMGGGGSICL